MHAGSASVYLAYFDIFILVSYCIHDIDTKSEHLMFGITQLYGGPVCCVRLREGERGGRGLVPGGMQRSGTRH